MKWFVNALLLAAAFAACSKSDNAASTPAATDSSSAAPAQSSDSARRGPRANSVRGRLVSVSDTALVVESRGGQVTVGINPPLEVYSRVPAKLSDVKPNSFVGITSRPAADGSMQASEIHIFPEKMRGTNEGSFAMGQRGGGGNAPGGGGAGNTMTNGTVAGSNNAGNQMTNGTVGTHTGNSLVVKFQNDSQTIVIPANVPVTAIALTKTKLTPGTNVVIQTSKAADGTLKASTVMISPARPGR